MFQLFFFYFPFLFFGVGLLVIVAMCNFNVVTWLMIVTFGIAMILDYEAFNLQSVADLSVCN